MRKRHSKNSQSCGSAQKGEGQVSEGLWGLAKYLQLENRPFSPLLSLSEYFLEAECVFQHQNLSKRWNMQLLTDDKKGTGRSSTWENPATVLQPQGKKLMKLSLSINLLGSPTAWLCTYHQICRYSEDFCCIVGNNYRFIFLFHSTDMLSSWIIYILALWLHM